MDGQTYSRTQLFWSHWDLCILTVILKVCCNEVLKKTHWDLKILTVTLNVRYIQGRYNGVPLYQSKEETASDIYKENIGAIFWSEW